MHPLKIPVSSSFSNLHLPHRPPRQSPTGDSPVIQRYFALNLWKISPHVPIEAHKLVQESGENCLQLLSNLSCRGKRKNLGSSLPGVFLTEPGGSVAQSKRWGVLWTKVPLAAY